MVLPATLPVSVFADRLQITDTRLVQGFQQQQSMTAGGDTRYADRAVSLWALEATTGPVPHHEAEAIMGLINSRAGGLKTFLCHNFKLPYPKDDPTGALLGVASPAINVIADRLHVSFSGFPPSYQLAVGTYFGVVFDTSRYYLGQILEPRTANPITGAVASVEIWPPLPATISSGAAVAVA
jgi:hypothetical protein